PVAGDPLDSGDQLNFTFALAAPESLAGSYRVQIDPTVEDVNGNKLNQDQDEHNGEVTQDGFRGTFQSGASTAQSIPYLQGFDVPDLESLAGWSFHTVEGGSIDFDTLRYRSSPQSLRLTGLSYDLTPQRVALKLNLQDHSSATDLAMDFFAMRGGTVYGSYVTLSASGDGETWMNVGNSLDLVTGQFQNYFLDLDSELDAVGIARDSDVYLRFNHIGNGQAFVPLEDLRIANRDADGPHIVSVTPATQVAGPVSSIEVIFNEPIDTATFTADDVQLIGISGSGLALDGDPVDSGDQTTFTVNLATPQTTLSNYRLTIGPDISDLAGNPMNQDRDHVNGESAADQFTSSFTIGPPTAQTVPYVQDFEVADMAALAGWEFRADAFGKISLTADKGPASGAKHLVFDLTQTRSLLSDSATLLMDLSDVGSVDDLVLDYRIQAASIQSGTNSMMVSVSGDGMNWTVLSPVINGVSSGYVNPYYDLSGALTAASIVADNDVYIRFEHTAQSIGRWMSIDDVRVSRRDPVGPRIVSTNLQEIIPPPFSAFDVTLSKPVEAATFGANDIDIDGPLQSIPVSSSADPIDSGDHQTFTLAIDEPQTQPGLYRVRIGYQLEDLDGNPMNQDGDQINGELSEDRFYETFRINPTPAAFPYFQGFADAYSPGVNWYFESSDGANINFGPTSQSGNMRMENANASVVSVNQAIASIDLTGQSSVRVHFDELNRYDLQSTYDGVFISDDQGATWYQAASALDTSSAWQVQEIDLDAAVAAASMTYSNDFWIKIQQASYSAPPWGGRVYDNFFVESGTPITVSLNVAETTEGTADPVTLTVSRDPAGDLTNPLDLTLFSNDESEATIPPTATIPSGQSSVEIPVTIIDDGDVDGPRSLKISAANLGLVPRSADLTVFDNEPATLTLLVDNAVVNEATGPNAATVTLRRNQDIDVALSVDLTSDDESEIIVPPTVTIPAGQVETTFVVSTQNDYVIDGTQSAMITASATDFVIGTVSIDVEDDDSLTRKTIGGRFAGTLPADAYEVLFDVVVLANTTLTIEPGTSLKFDAATKLDVGGTVLAQGQEGSKIVMTSLNPAPSPGDWTGVDFNAEQQAASLFDYVEIMHAVTGMDVSQISSPRFSITNSEIHDNLNHAINLVAGRSDFIESNAVFIEKNQIHDNGLFGVYILSDASSGGATRANPTIAGNEIYGHASAGVFVASRYQPIGGLAATSGVANPIVFGNYIHDNQQGIVAGVHDPSDSNGSAFTAGQYSNNLIINNAGHGFALTQSDDGLQASTISNNTIVGNGGAGIFHDRNLAFDLTIRNNIVTANATGIEADFAFAPTAGRVGFNDVFGNNGGNWINYPATFGVATTTNANGTPSDDEFNLNVDPEFEAGTLYEPVDASLVNDAGTDNGAPYNDYLGALRYSPHDIGAYEHDPVTNVVTTLLDEDDGGLGLGTGNSLREIINAANARPVLDVIAFDPQLFGGTIILGGTPLPALTRAVEIRGPGADVITVSGGGQSRIFDVGANVNVTISGMTLRDAVNSAIYSNGKLTVRDSVLTSNSAGSGGAIFSERNLTIERSTISNNSATSSGGGIFVRGSGLIIDSTIDHNTAQGNGGGIINQGTITIINSTISNNEADSGAGAIENLFSNTILTNSTVAFNQGGDVGGIARGTITLHNSIVAHNVRDAGLAPYDLTEVEPSSSNNLIGDPATSGGLANGVNGNIIGVDPLLAPLADNGGPTKTHALLNNSLAIDAGNNDQALDQTTGALETDQRGPNFPRIVDGDRSGTSTVDIGAFETPPPPIVLGIAIGDGNEQRSKIDRLVVHFDQEVLLDNSGGNPFELVNLNSNESVDVSVGATEPGAPNTVTLTFLPGPSVGPGGGLLDGNYRLMLKADRIGTGVMPLDGDGDGSGGGNHLFGTNPTDNFFRLFGDSDGDRDVDGQDFGKFGLSFLKSLSDPQFDPIFDFDDDGDVDGQDYGRFERSFLNSI
ncbi:MAG: right-handed parallel beta-helix repeat-containing protein, partial [Planctomycetales bacterium]|nr:right-handed parallel beta-helix repeat-containing protein [Planctomycetales bacterium]